MMKLLRWSLPVATMVGGFSLGAWISGGKDLAGGAVPVAPKAAAPVVQTVAKPASVVGDQATAEEAVREQEARQLWQTAGLKQTLEALTAYARVNPARALELAMSLKGDDAWELVMKLVQTLPVSAGGVAMDVLLRHPQYCKACPPLDAVFGLCAKFDPERAWREAHGAGVKFTSAALDAIARTCGESNPRKGMELAARLGEGKEQMKFKRTVLRGWAESDARDLVAWLGTQADVESLCLQVPWGKMRFETQADFLAMVRVVPPGVLDGTLGPGYSFGTAGEDGWATRLDWLQAVTDEAARRALFAGAARALIDADPEKALALLPEIGDARLRRQITSATAAYRAASSPEAGLAYAETLTDETARRMARQSVLTTWAESDPAAAAKYAMESGLSADDAFIVVRQRLGGRWAELDPQGAATYALAHEPQNPNQATPDSLLSSAMRQWVNQDPYAASGWVSALPAGVQRDQAVAVLAHAAIRAEPDGALAWAGNIADPALRQHTLQNCFALWVRADHDQAARWLEQAVLDASTRQILNAAVQSVAGQQQGPSWFSRDGIIVVH